MRGHVPWVIAERLERIEVEQALENAIVVVVPVKMVEDAIIVVIIRVRSVASIETFDQIVDAVVVVVKVIEIIDSVVVVSTSRWLLQHGSKIRS